MAKILIGVIAVAVLGYGVFSISQKSRIATLENSQDKGKLTWYAEMAKAKGDKEVHIGSGIVRYGVPRTFEEALANFDSVVGEVVTSQSFPEETEITTWYKFKLIENISTPTIECSRCPSIPEPPTAMLPINQNEFLLPQVGGEVLVDGIKIKSRNSQFPPFEIGKQYLLFLSFDSQKIAAVSRMGPWGTFKSTNGKLEAVDAKLTHPTHDELQRRFGSSLSSFRTFIKVMLGVVSP